LSEIRTALEQTREVAIDLRLEHQRIANKIAVLEAAIEHVTGNPLPPLPLLPHTGEAAADAGALVVASAVTHESTVFGGLGCVGWKQTGACDPAGPREPVNDQTCITKILSKYSGFCECENATKTYAVECVHADFTCAKACEEKPFLDMEMARGEDGPLVQKWQRTARKHVSQHPDMLPTAKLSEFVESVEGLTESDCPSESWQMYRNVPIVYTWVNGSEPSYKGLREGAGGPKAVGGARDRDSGELRFSIRSVAKFLPWWRGVFYIVSPNQVPSWIDREHPRLRIVDQDDLFLSGDKDVLPTFNTNAIEQLLWRVPGNQSLILHMNDDYIFTSQIEPQDLFGPTCDGMRLLLEKGTIKHRGESEIHDMLEKGGRTWLNSVANSIFALDKRYNPKLSTHPYLKHSPFVYSRAACEAVNSEYRAEMRTTMENKFRHGGDVIMPLIHHAYMRGEGFSRHSIHLTVATTEEMTMFILLSLSGDEAPDPKNPSKQTAAMEHSAQRASKWYGKILSGATPAKMVTLNDEMGGATNQTVVAQFHHFALAILPRPTDFEAVPFIPVDLPGHTVAGHLEFDIETHQPGFLKKLNSGFFSRSHHQVMHDIDDGMRR
jgi:hypothetical protein